MAKKDKDKWRKMSERASKLHRALFDLENNTNGDEEAVNHARRELGLEPNWKAKRKKLTQEVKAELASIFSITEGGVKLKKK